MPREEIIRLIRWTMRYYGSDAGERKEPGSKLRAQAEHIADVIEEYDRLMALTRGSNFSLVLAHHDLDD